MKKFVSTFIIFLNLFFFILLYTKKIDLTTADLGRHLKNGEIILKEGITAKVLTTNFYSYTLPNQPFVNHHWLTGVIFYLIYKNFNFYGLSIFYTWLGIITWLILLIIAKKESNWFLAGFFGLFLLPLVVFRTEIRPEGFTYFFVSIFLFLAVLVRKNELDKNWLFLLPILIIFWINLHIGFIFGYLILAAFLFDELIKLIFKKSNQFLFLLKITSLTIIFSLINPHGIQGALFPFQIFKNYGYLIVENQGVLFLQNLGFGKTLPLFHFKLVVVVLIISYILSFVFEKKITSFFYFLPVVITGFMAFFGIRHFPIFAFFALPVLAKNFNLSKKMGKEETIYIFSLVGFFLFWMIFNLSLDFYQKRSLFGLGLLPGVNQAADFLKQNKIKGPIFNNYDIGGYLIFHFFPKEKVFVDNRPEAYQIDFFEKIYKKSQSDLKSWEKLLQKYQFNVIIFSHRDYTSWGQNFLVNMIENQDFVPVFADDYNIIFLRRNKRNDFLIKKYQIAKEKFKVVRN